jgi:hypothetical protein
VCTLLPGIAKKCFDYGLNLAQIRVIPDVKSEIISTVRELSLSFALVLTSGGIGNTDNLPLRPPFSLSRTYTRRSYVRLHRRSIQSPSNPRPGHCCSHAQALPNHSPQQGPIENGHSPETGLCLPDTGTVGSSGSNSQCANPARCPDSLPQNG